MNVKRTFVNVSNISIEQTKSQQRQSQEARGQQIEKRNKKKTCNRLLQVFSF